ncbi:MAG: sensor histidine kinase, partial [Anaerolineae bacterium]|nr:sensor histidine kinase [Anaerolineae bacterium]
MTDVQGILHINWIILYFVYGQVFFVTGLIIALQTDRWSELDLARTLPWLAAFGLLHGFTEWGYIFVPLQGLYLPPTWFRVTQVLHMFILGLSFACLLEFGLVLFSSKKRWGWVGALAFALWLASGPAVGLAYGWPLTEWLNVWEILARYFVAFPGALLASAGLVLQARDVRQMGFGEISRFLIGAGVAFGVYSVVGGLAVPDGPFFPASWLNYSLVQTRMGVPVPVFRSLCGLAIVYTVTRSLQIFRLRADQVLAEMRRQRLLAEERERISRDLHDGTIQSIYGAGLRLQAALQKMERSPEEARRIVGQVLEGLNATIEELRCYIFSLEGTQAHQDLESSLSELIQETRLDTFLEADLRIAGPPCCSLQRHQVEHLVQIAREAISNVVRHAQATRVRVSLTYGGQFLGLRVEDNGMGLPREGARQGLGLRNMQQRAQLLGGSLEIRSRDGRGTVVEVL